MGKTRNLFKKIRYTKGRFHAKMGTIKNRSDMDLKQKMLRQGSKNPQKNYTKKDLYDQNNISFKEWYNKGQKSYGPNRCRKY